MNQQVDNWEGCLHTTLTYIDTYLHIHVPTHTYLHKLIQWGKKTNEQSNFFSNFMSFSPIDFIFIGCIGYELYFCWVLRNFDFKPTNSIFSPKRQMNHFRKWSFLGVWCRKLTFRENGVMDMANMLDSVLKRSYKTFPNIFS